MAELFSIGLYTLIVAYAGVGALRVWAERRLLALPNERSSHTIPTPSGGGLIIVLATLLGTLLFALLANCFSIALWSYLAGAVLIAVVSWLDDLNFVSIHVRLIVHGLSALCFLGGAGVITQMEAPLVAPFPLGWFGIGLSFLWIVGLTNVGG
jgi:UDP-N-acetylmuramyl pentapeptide phosphotransferase/UDP-N-acetylglucosamine-1-phosphate transferase